MKESKVISYTDLQKSTIDIEGKDLLIAFSEAAFRKSHKDAKIADIDSKLNARLPAYFLPAITIAQQQKQRPRLLLVSGVFAAAKWSAHSEEERRIMLANNQLKINFLKKFFTTFFKDAFSIIDYRFTYDFLKTSDHKLEQLWNVFEKKYPNRLQTVKEKLLKYKSPKSFANGIPSDKELEKLFIKNEAELKKAFKYAIVHLFAMGDINIGWDFAHNPNGYCSIGEHHEATFNVIRDMGYETLQEVGELVFDQPVYAFDNMRVVIENTENVPPAYNGATRSSRRKGTWLDEVTYENREPLTYYDDRPKLQSQMNHIYDAIGKQEYQDFWNNFQDEYFDLKSRYKEAYKIDREF